MSGNTKIFVNRIAKINALMSIGIGATLIFLFPRIVSNQFSVIYSPVFVTGLGKGDVFFWQRSEQYFALQLYPDILDGPSPPALSEASWPVRQCVLSMADFEETVVLEIWGFPYPCFIANHEAQDVTSQNSADDLPFRLDGVATNVLILNISLITVTIFPLCVLATHLANKFVVKRSRAQGRK